MAAGVTKRLWEIGDIVEALEAWESAIGTAEAQKRRPSKVKLSTRQRVILKLLASFGTLKNVYLQ